MEKFDSVQLSVVLDYIEQADDFEIQEIMAAVRRRYAIGYPQWDVIYAAVHKDPTIRKKDLEDLVAYIEKDLKWMNEKRTPSY